MGTNNTNNVSVKVKKLAEAIFEECKKDGEPVTFEEAVEMAEMEIQAKTEVKRYEQADTPKEKKPKIRKVDETKKRLLDDFRVLLEGLQADIISVKTETEINFDFEGDNYTIKLTRHKPKKNNNFCIY